MVFKDYYKILNLETTEVDFDDIKNAYRYQVKQFHPDRNKKNTEEIIQDINEAYKVLSDTNLKRKYDRKWKTHVERNRIGNKTYEAREQNRTLKEEVYSMFFGDFAKKIKKKNEPTLTRLKGENIKTEININLEDGFFGVKKYIALRDVNGTLQRIPIDIPVGIKNNDRIRVVGLGKPGQNEGKNGDLFVNIKIENDKNMFLEGSDIRTIANIYPWEAALGTSITVSVFNEELKLKIPAGTQSGKRFEVPQKGYYDGFGGRGNLLIDININMPQKISDEELELYRKIEKLRKE